MYFNSVKMGTVIFLLLLISSCIFEEDIPQFDYNVKAGEAFSASWPSIEIDAGNNVHILAKVHLLYVKEHDDPVAGEKMSRNEVAYHYTLSGSPPSAYNFENMSSGQNAYFLGQRNLSPELYAVVPDLSKLIVYLWGASGWQKVRSVSIKSNGTYEFYNYHVLVDSNDVYIPFYTTDISGDYWGSKFAGVKINDNNILIRPDIDSQFEYSQSWPSSPTYINETYYLPVQYYSPVANKYLHYLYRVTKDTIISEVLGDKDGDDYHGSWFKSFNNHLYFYTFSEDSISQYDIDTLPAVLIRSYNIELLPGDLMSTSYDIDNYGCEHLLGIDNPQLSEYKDGYAIYDSKVSFLYYLNSCSGAKLDTISLPDSLNAYQFSYLSSIAVDKSGEPHIVALLPSTSQIPPYEIYPRGWQEMYGARLYHIYKQGGVWSFELVDEK